MPESPREKALRNASPLARLNSLVADVGGGDPEKRAAAVLAFWTKLEEILDA